MEEENALRIQHAKLSVTYLVEQRPFPVRLEAAHHEAEMFQNIGDCSRNVHE